MKVKILVILIVILSIISISVQAVVPGRTYFDAKNNYFKYIIKAGDTLYNISRVFRIDLTRLQGLNNRLNPLTLQIGDVVIISINKNLEYYVIRPGDNLWKISQTRNYLLTDIIAYNKLENAAYLVPGEVIFLPKIIARSNNIKVMEFEKKHNVIYVSGVARVFEATVNYALETSTGQILKEGFTTALAGGPEWGRYDFRIIGIPARARYLTIFSISARDGSRQDLVKLEL